MLHGNDAIMNFNFFLYSNQKFNILQQRATVWGATDGNGFFPMLEMIGQHTSPQQVNHTSRQH